MLHHPVSPVLTADRTAPTARGRVPSLVQTLRPVSVNRQLALPSPFRMPPLWQQVHAWLPSHRYNAQGEGASRDASLASRPVLNMLPGLLPPRAGRVYVLDTVPLGVFPPRVGRACVLDTVPPGVL